MSEIPEDKKTVEGEGKDLASAIAAAAEELGVEPGDVGYKLDLSHFRNQTGGMKPARSVKIIGWVEEGATDISDIAASGGGGRKRSGKKRSGKKRSGKKRSGKKRSGKKRSGKKGRSDKPRDDKKPSDVDAQGAAEFAESWFSTLLDHMGIGNKVTATVDDDRVHLDVRAERAGRVIGRRGSTLRAIRFFLRQALDKYGSPNLDIDVEDMDEDKRSGKKKKKKSGKKKSSDDKGGYPEAKLQALGRRAAEKARDTNKTVTINLKLSSYDRRIVHLAVSEIDGVHSQSEEKDGGKVVQVIPD